MTNLSPKDKAMKSKEEIIDEKSLRADYFSDATEVLWSGDVSRIMDQYSEQKEKELLKWLREELFITKDPDEVYDLYKKSK